MEINKEQKIANSSFQPKFSNPIISPVKDYNPFGTPLLKTDGKYPFMNSPFIPSIQTPAKPMDWAPFMALSNETPFGASKIFSPLVSAGASKVNYQNYSFAQKNLLTEFR